ncbi:hypothetical protein TorRG33x02_268370, partial [Trema orientale]
FALPPPPPPFLLLLYPTILYLTLQSTSKWRKGSGDLLHGVWVGRDYHGGILKTVESVVIDAGRGHQSRFNSGWAPVHLEVEIFHFFVDFPKTHDCGGNGGARLIHDSSLDCSFHWCFCWLGMET